MYDIQFEFVLAKLRILYILSSRGIKITTTLTGKQHNSRIWDIYIIYTLVSSFFNGSDKNAACYHGPSWQEINIASTDSLQMRFRVSNFYPCGVLCVDLPILYAIPPFRTVMLADRFPVSFV